MCMMLRLRRRINQGGHVLKVLNQGESAKKAAIWSHESKTVLVLESFRIKLVLRGWGS